MSITQIWERLFIGRIADAAALADSNPYGITTVVNVCPEAVPNKVPVGINYRFLPLLGDRPNLPESYNRSIVVLWINIRHRTVLIHSFHGVNRAPIMAAAWMHVVGYKNIDAALAEIAKVRPIEPNPILLKSIKEHL